MTRAPLLSRVSLRAVVPLAMVVPVLLVVIALGVIVWINGRASASDLERQIFDQLGQRIDQRLSEFIEMPSRINRLNAHLIRSGVLDPADLRSWSETLYQQIDAFEGVSSIGFGTPEGHATWMIRYGGEVGYEWAIQDDQTGSQIYEYGVTPDGQIGRLPRGSYPFDATQRPWYLAGVETQDQQAWSEVFAWARATAEIPELGLGRVMPVYDESGELLGVHDTELSLSQISAFLGGLSIGEGGSAYVVDERSLMIAASVRTALAERPATRLHASQLDDPRAIAIAGVLRTEYGGIGSIDRAQDLLISADGEAVRVRVMPLRNTSGLRWWIWIALPENELLARTHEARAQTVQAGLIATGIVLLLGIGLSLVAVRPLLRLVEQVRSIGEGDFDDRSDVSFTSELTLLSESLNTVGAQLQDRMRLKQSLELAMEVQQNLLPDEAPKIDGIDVFGHSTYCDETGGDYYDFLDVSGVSSSMLGVALGDVMGHGIAAALLMATARAALRSRVSDGGSLASLLEHTNAMLVTDTKGVSFMTMLLMLIDAGDRSVRWASAGQDPPFIYSPESGEFLELNSSSFPLGIMERGDYTEQRIGDLPTGAVLVVGTDGLWESQNAAGEPFGKDRFRDAIRRSCAGSAEAIADAIRKDLGTHCAEVRPDDDITLVVVKFTG